jgi:predicted N-formylglutamate amidohydrolase
MLLQSYEPGPFELINIRTKSHGFLTCDHASNRIPASLHGLGLSREDLSRHIALDIGAADVTRALSQKLNLPAIIANYSRLVIDCNRKVNHVSAIATSSDGTLIPGNQNLSSEHRMTRIQEIFVPYHLKINWLISQNGRPGMAQLNMHSFTPRMNGFDRPWHIGILWNRDDRLSSPLFEILRAHQDLVIGDNQPYSAQKEDDYCMEEHHAAKWGLPQVTIEMRQDLISTPSGVEHMANILAEAFEPILARL